MPSLQWYRSIDVAPALNRPQSTSDHLFQGAPHWLNVSAYSVPGYSSRINHFSIENTLQKKERRKFVCTSKLGPGKRHPLLAAVRLPRYRSYSYTFLPRNITPFKLQFQDLTLRAPKFVLVFFVRQWAGLSFRQRAVVRVQISICRYPAPDWIETFPPSHDWTT